MIFALFFLMLGSSKLLGPFAAATKDGDHVFRFRLATRAVLFSIGAAAISASLGGRMLDNFVIPVLVLQTPILFLVALQVMHHFSAARAPRAPRTTQPGTRLLSPCFLLLLGVVLGVNQVGLGIQLMIGGISGSIARGVCTTPSN